MWLCVAAIVCTGIALALLTSGPAAPTPPQPPVQATPPDGPKPGPRLTVPPAAEKDAEVGHLGTVRLSDDAGAKQGDFWLEQHLTLPATESSGELADLYLTLDPKTAAGLRLRVRRNRLILERLAAPVEGQAAQPEPLAEAELGAALPVGPARLGALWRGGTLSVWWDDARLFSWRGEADLRGPSAAAALAAGVKLGMRRALDAGRTEFRDGFMGEGAGGLWRPSRGKWELTQLTFPERSANPFSLRASFGDEPPADDKLYRDRLRHDDVGIGVMLGASEGTLHIVRITGGSPAQRAGLQEDDTIVEVNGQPVESYSPWRAQRQLTLEARSGRPFSLKVLRPGEKRLREFTLTGDIFRWGTPMVGKPLQPVSDSDDALILGGEAGWTDYAVEVAVKPLGAGGCGLALAATSPDDYVLLRWLGPKPRVAPEAGGAARDAGDEKLQLIRVQGGRAAVLAEKPLRYRPYEFYRLALDWKGEEVTARVDGVRVFQERIPGLERGRIGLYALRGDPVFFDDVNVVSERGKLASGQGPARDLNAIFALEQDMERWANPALEWRRGEADEWAVHTARFPGEQQALLTRPRFEELEVRLLCGEATPERSGVPTLTVRAGRASLAAEGHAKAEAEVGPGPFERIVFRAGPRGIVAEIDGKPLLLSLQAGDAPPRAEGDRVAIRGLRNLGDPQTVRVRSTQALEYTFNEAPADWKVESGRWGLLNKWICDPRWSWFGGRSATLASIWSKQAFSGDVTADAHIALMMQRDDPPYERPGDYVLAIQGDGAHFDSGYAAIVGGGGNYWTKLFRKGREVAVATDEDLRLPSDRVRHPDKPELHQRWFHLRLERIGDKVRFFRDGKLAFEYTDPEPLSGGRAGFGTLDNGVMLSRFRIAYGGAAAPAPLDSRLPQLYDDGDVINMFDGEIHSRVEREALPEPVRRALAAEPSAFAPAEAGKVDGAGMAWRVVNGVGGGPVALQWKKKLVDLNQMGVVRFAARIEPGSIVDLGFKDLATGECYRWRLSGSAAHYEDVPLLGDLGVPADGRWHAVQADLGRDWAAFWARRGFRYPPGATLRPMLASLDNRTYALAGFGGNRVGATYAVSDLSFLRASDADRTPPKLAAVIWPFDAEGDGRRLELRFDDAGGSGVDPTTLQVLIQGKLVGEREIRFDAAKQTARIDLFAVRGEQPFADGEGVALSVGRFADRAGNAVAEGISRTWTFRLLDAAAAKKPAALPQIEALMDVDAPLGRGGRNMVPTAARLDLEQASPTGAAREMLLQEADDAPAWALEPRSLRVVSLMDGARLGLGLRATSYDLAHWPYLVFDYKVPPEVPLNLFYRAADGEQQTVYLNDLGFGEDRFGGGRFGRRRRASGPPEEFKDDGTWRRAEFNLLSYFAASNPELSDYRISMLSLMDQGYQGNRRGMDYFVHALRALPASRSRGIAFKWSAPDLCGAAEFQSLVDDKPDSEPHGQGLRALESVEGGAKRAKLEAGTPPEQLLGPVAKDGWHWLHVRVKNRAGQWSPTAHYKFRIDNTPPRLVRIEPADGGALSGKTIRFHFEEDHAILPGSIVVAVNGRAFVDGHMGCRYDPETKVLTFDGSKLGERLPWPEDGALNVAVGGATDTLGNRMPEARTFRFQVAPGQDRAGPTIAKLRYCAPQGVTGQTLFRPQLLELSMALDFEETLGHVRTLRDCRLEWTDDPRTAAFGERAARFVTQADDADVRIMLHKNAWYLDQLPLLHFDYKAEGPLALDLQIQVLGEWYTIRFLGSGGGEHPIGAIEGVRADGQWHHAGVNLHRLVRNALPNLPVEIASQIILSAHGEPGCKRGSALWLDNLHMLPESGSGCWLEWEAEDDPNGIEGYSILIDRRPDTEAPEALTDTGTCRQEGNHTGTVWAHVRARDQAGNWGPTRHLRLDF
ncbi:MAG: PDZ domain-containing protein [Planctomycetota bacterium]|nr:PDZ domain-containing protein [Planctomycetota bacterium]